MIRDSGSSNSTREQPRAKHGLVRVTLNIRDTGLNTMSADEGMNQIMYCQMIDTPENRSYFDGAVAHIYLKRDAYRMGLILRFEESFVPQSGAIASTHRQPVSRKPKQV
jgi:hypothetical protein